MSNEARFASYPNPSNIKIGDVVRAATGSRRMSVVQIDDDDGVGMALCVYQEGSYRWRPEKKELKFPVAALRKCWLRFI